MLRNKVLVSIVVVAAMGVSALAAYVRMVPHGAAPQTEVFKPAPPTIAAHVPEPATIQPTMVTVYNPHMGTDGINFEAQPTAVPAGADPKVFAVAEFLKAAQITPEKAQLLSIQVEDGVAHLGFSREFGRTYATFEEKSLLDGFAAALGQFPDVNSYQLEIDGKPVPTLGSVSLGDPVPVIRPADVPRPGATSSPPSSTDEPVPNPTPSDQKPAGPSVPGTAAPVLTPGLPVPGKPEPRQPQTS